MTKISTYNVVIILQVVYLAASETHPPHTTQKSLDPVNGISTASGDDYEKHKSEGGHSVDLESHARKIQLQESASLENQAEAQATQATSTKPSSDNTQTEEQSTHPQSAPQSDDLTSKLKVMLESLFEWMPSHDNPPATDWDSQWTAEKHSAKDTGAGGLFADGMAAMFPPEGEDETTRNLTRAAELFSVAASSGHSAAQSSLAFLHSFGLGVKKDPALAALYHTFAAQGDSSASHLALAHATWPTSANPGSGNIPSTARFGGDEDAKRSRRSDCLLALPHFHAAAETTVMFHLAPRPPPLTELVMLASDDLSVDSDSAHRGHAGEEDDLLQYVLYTAERGTVSSLRTMGELHFHGARGLTRDPARALPFFHQAAEAGDVQSLVYLGGMYVRGMGVERNESQALHFFQQAADQGSVGGVNALGFMLVYGYGGLARDYQQAKSLFTKAARVGDVNGHYNLGAMAMEGLAEERGPNMTAAVHHLQEAAKGGHIQAQYQLGRLLNSGLVTVPSGRDSCSEAIKLFKAVASRGPWCELMRWAHMRYMRDDLEGAALLYLRAAHLGLYPLANLNAAWVLDKIIHDANTPPTPTSPPPPASASFTSSKPSFSSVLCPPPDDHHHILHHHHSRLHTPDNQEHTQDGSLLPPTSTSSSASSTCAAHLGRLSLHMWRQAALLGDNQLAWVKVGETLLQGGVGVDVDIPTARSIFEGVANLQSAGGSERARALVHLAALAEADNLTLTAERYYKEALDLDPKAWLLVACMLVRLRILGFLQSFPSFEPGMRSATLLDASWSSTAAEMFSVVADSNLFILVLCLILVLIMRIRASRR